MISEKLSIRLKECGVTIDEILSKLPSIDKSQTVIVYTSHMDGVGNKNSDCDVYVLVENVPNDNRFWDFSDCKSSFIKINDLIIDVEYWTYGQIVELIKLNNFNKDITKMKLLTRLMIGDIIYGEKKGCEIKKEIELINIKKQIFNYYQGMVNQEYDDAVKMFESDNYYCSINCGRRALDYLIAAYSAINGTAVLNLKWIPQILISNKGFGDYELFKEYFKFQFFIDIKKIGINNYAEELLMFVSRKMFEICHLS